MRLKKLLLASIFLVVSLFIISSCSTSSNGKQESNEAKITGKIEKGDIQEATCKIQGLDPTTFNLSKAKPIKAVFHSKNSTYTVNELPKDSIVEVTCTVKKYYDEISKQVVTGDFDLTTIGNRVDSTLNINVLTTLATEEAKKTMQSGPNVVTAMKTAIGNQYRNITRRTDFPITYDPATSSLDSSALRRVTAAVLYEVHKNHKNLADILNGNGKISTSEMAKAYTAAAKDSVYNKFINEGRSTGTKGNGLSKSPRLGDIKSGQPTENVGGNADIGYTLELPSTYTPQEEASFKINVLNGNDKYLIISDGTTAIPSTITGDTQTDVTTGDIKGFLTDIATTNKDLFICILDTMTTVENNCNADTSSVAKLTVSIVRYEISFSKSTIGQVDSPRIIRSNGYNAAGVGDIAGVKFTLKSDDVHVLGTAQTVKYAMSSYQDTAASFSWNGINRHPIDMTLDTATDISSLFNGFRGTPDTGNLRTFNVCMLASTATKDDCPYDVKVDGVKVLAVASFKAASGTAVVLQPGLGDPLSETERVPAEATWTKMPFGMGYMGILPQGYKAANFGVTVFNADSKFLILSDGTTAISSAITGDDTKIKIDDIKPLLTDISVASGKTLYLCIADTVTTEGTTCDKDTAGVTLVMMSIKAPGLSSITKNKPETSIAGGTFIKTQGYTLVLPLGYNPAQDETSFKIKVSNGDSQYVVVSDGTRAIASTEAIVGDAQKEVTTGDIKSLVTGIAEGTPKKLFICVLPNSSPVGIACQDSTDGVAPLTVMVNPKIAFSKSSIGQASSLKLIKANKYNVGGVGDSNIEFTLSADDVNIPDGVTYAIMSTARWAYQREITVGTSVDLGNNRLFNSNKVTFTVCMLSKIADIRDCNNGVQADGKKVLATATFKAEKGSATVKPSLGPLTTVPTDATWSQMLGQIMVVLPKNYTTATTASLGMNVFDGDGKFLVVSDGTTAISSAAVTGDTAEAAISDVKSLLTGIAVGTSKELYICIADVSTTDGTTCKNGTAGAFLLSFSITEPILGNITKNKPEDSTISIDASGYKLELPTTYTTVSEASVNVAVTQGAGKYVVVSNGTTAVPSAVIIGNTKASVTTGDIKGLVTGIVAGTDKTLFICVLGTASRVGTDCDANNDGAGKLTVSIKAATP